MKWLLLVCLADRNQIFGLDTTILDDAAAGWTPGHVVDRGTNEGTQQGTP